jgi:hypothetical protein
MWFLFGFVTLGVACVSSFAWRRLATWRGKSDRVGGIDYTFKVSTSKGRVTGAKVGVVCDDTFTFSVRPESAFDLFSKRIGLSRECQTGDGAFDRAFYILSDDPVFHRMLQLDRRLRDDIAQIFEHCRETFGKPRSLQVRGGRIWIDAQPRAKKRADAEADSRSMAGVLNAVAVRLVPGGTSIREERDPFPLRAAGVLAVSTGLCLAGGIGLFHAVSGAFPRLADATEPLPAALLIGLSVILMLSATALRIMGQSARTHLVLLELVLSGTLGASAVAYAELRDYNMEFDTGAVTHVAAEVVGKRVTHSSKGGTHYHIDLRGWPDDGQLDLEVSEDFFAQVGTGSHMTITERPGALGWRWAAAMSSE